MTRLISYLTFKGNCREAMHFYQSCLGGKLSFQTLGQSPDAAKLPAQMKNFILHSVLQKDEMILMASDMVPEEGLIRGNDISILVYCNTREELVRLYSRLSVGAMALLPPASKFWDSLPGSLTDRYGYNWFFQLK